MYLTFIFHTRITSITAMIIQNTEFYLGITTIWDGQYSQTMQQARPGKNHPPSLCRAKENALNIRTFKKHPELSWQTNEPTDDIVTKVYQMIMVCFCKADKKNPLLSERFNSVLKSHSYSKFSYYCDEFSTMPCLFIWNSKLTDDDEFIKLSNTVSNNLKYMLCTLLLG